MEGEERNHGKTNTRTQVGGKKMLRNEEEEDR